MRKTLIREGVGYRVFNIVNICFMALYALLAALPFIHIAAVSLSDHASTMAGKVALWPVGININAYKNLIFMGDMLRGFVVTIERMALGGVYTLILIVSFAYPMSYEGRAFPGRKAYLVYFMITMFIGGGIVPYYVLINDLGLMDNILALIVGASPVSLAVILMNFFRRLPPAMGESAMIDGASHYQILARIYLPLSLPSLMTLLLMTLVGHWNEWFGGLIYMKSPANYPLQTYIRTCIANETRFTNSLEETMRFSASRPAMLAALNTFSIMIILAVYPVLQKYMATGLVLGAVKE